MYNTHRAYQCPYCANAANCNADSMYNDYSDYQNPYFVNTPMYEMDFSRQFEEQFIPYDDETDYAYRLDSTESDKSSNAIELKDYGPQPFVVDINEATKQNSAFRTALWTGKHLQLTLMSINVGDDIGLEIHPNVDQFLRVEEGQGLVKMGKNKEKLDFQAKVQDDYAILVPAGTWHNVINTGDIPLKIYSIYAPPQHPRGTVHLTKADAEKNHH